MVTFRSQFNKKEIEALVSTNGFSGIVVDQLLANNYYEMRRAVEEIIDKALEEVSTLLKQVEKIEHSFMDYIAKQRMKFEDVFITPDNDVLKAIQCRYRNDYHNRVLKPIVRSKKDFASLMLGNFTCPDAGEFLDHLINDMSYNDLNFFLYEQVRLAPGFVEHNFSFMKVLENNLPYWNETIQKQLNENPEKCDDTKHFFRRHLGAEPYDLDILKASIALRLAEIVRPNPYNFRDADLFGDLAIMVPFEQAYLGVEGILHDRFNPDFSISVCGLPHPASSPFAYFALCDIYINSKESRVFDLFPSLDYYKDREVAERLQEVEREDGKSIFTTNHRLRGLGYISPLYVQDKEWSDSRWKPWVRDKK